MTVGGIIASLFPLFHTLSIGSLLCLFVLKRDPIYIPLILAAIYVLPLLIFRVHNIFFPLKDGFWDLSKKKYNAWWTVHQLQYLFIAIPWLEAPLHFVPGLFSTWLRLWGSKIGKNVFWTPRVEVVDRGLVEIEDNVLIGHISGMVSHMVAPMEGRPMLVIKKVKIGRGALIGADTQLGPGAKIAAKAHIKPKSAIYWRGNYSPETSPVELDRSSLAELEM